MTLNDQIDALFDAAINNWQIRGMVVIDTAFAAGLIDGLRFQVLEVLEDATLTEDSTELD